MKRQLFSIYASVAIFFISVIHVNLMAIGFLFLGSTIKRKNYVHWVSRLWGRNCMKAVFSLPEIRGLENIISSHNYVIVANHASGFDIIILLGFIGLDIIFISKRANFKIPFIGLAMRIMGCIPIERNHHRAARESIEAAAKSYRQGDNIIIFPESTRSDDGLPKPFKQGFLHIAKNQTTRILPVTLSGTANIHSKGNWHIVPSRTIMVVDKPIIVTPDEVNDVVKRSKTAANLEKIIQANFVNLNSNF